MYNHNEKFNKYEHLTNGYGIYKLRYLKRMFNKETSCQSNDSSPFIERLRAFLMDDQTHPVSLNDTPNNIEYLRFNRK